MYKLMVSYDCGASYTCEAKAETPEELYPIGDELDRDGLRWVIEGGDGKTVKNCSIHNGTAAFIVSMVSPQ